MRIVVILSIVQLISLVTSESFTIEEIIGEPKFSCLSKYSSNINLGKWSITPKLIGTVPFDLTNCKGACDLFSSSSSYQVLGPFSNDYILERKFSFPEPHYQVRVFGILMKCDVYGNSLNYDNDYFKVFVDGIQINQITSNLREIKFGFVVPHSQKDFHLQIIPYINSDASIKLMGLKSISLTVYTNTFILSLNKCICPSNYLLSSFECIDCASQTGMFFNSITGQCEELCGIGKKVSSMKKCDDGNLIDGDGCSSKCLIEENYSCQLTSNLLPQICYLNKPLTFSIQLKETIKLSSPCFLLTFDRGIESISGELNQIFQVSVNDIPSNLMKITWTQFSSSQFKLQIEWTASIVGKQLNVQVKQRDMLKDINGISVDINNSQRISIPDFYYTSTEDTDLAITLRTLSRIIQLVQIAMIPLFFVSNQYHDVMNAVDMNQIITYLRLIQIRYPNNLSIFLEAFQDFDFKWMPNLFEVLIPSDLSKYNFDQQYTDNDLLTNVFYLRNAGPTLTIWVCFLAIYGILKILSSTVLVNLKTLVTTRFNWLWFIDIIWLLAMNIMISCFLQFSNLLVDNIYDVINIIVLAVNFIIFFILFPIRCYQIIIRNRFSYLDPEYGHLWSGLNTSDFKSCFFHLVYYLRKMVFACTIIILYDQTQVQVNVLNFFSIFTLLFLIIKNPFKKYKHNLKVFVSELLLFIAQIYMIELKNNIDSSDEQRIQTGWVIVFAFLGVLILQAGFTMFQAYLNILKWWKERKIKEKKQNEKKQKNEKSKMKKKKGKKSHKAKAQANEEREEGDEEKSINKNSDDQSSGSSSSNSSEGDSDKDEEISSSNSSDSEPSESSLPAFQRIKSKKKPAVFIEKNRKTIFIYKDTASQINLKRIQQK